MGFEEILAMFQQKAADVAGFGGTIRMDVEGAGSILMDGTGEGVEVSQSKDDADTTVGLSLETLQGLLSGDINPAMAFMSGKLNVGGNMGLAMKLQSMLGGD